MSPRFLYLYADNDPTEANASAHNLASRISFFLHGSVPDTELHQHARNGSLLDDNTLSAQVDRLLNDEKMKRFCDSFGSQWLQLDRLISSQPNREKFPGFYHGQFRTSMWMQSEPLLLFETIFIENRSIFDFIQPDFTYRSQELNEFYAKGKLPKRQKKSRTARSTRSHTF